MSVQNDIATMRSLYGENFGYAFYITSDTIKTDCTSSWIRKDFLSVGNWLLTNPIFSDDFNIDWDPIENSVYFREKISKTIQFTDIPARSVIDYACIMNVPVGEEITIYVYRDCGFVGRHTLTQNLIYTGWFTRRNGTINEDDCTIDIQLTTIDDGYDCFLREYEVEHNALNVLPSTLKHRTWTPPFHRGREVSDIIQYLLDQMSCGLTYKSDFFDNTDGSTKNYVTNVDPNPLNNLMLEDKSDAIAISEELGGGPAAEFATIHNLSMKELIRILRNHYDIRWYIDGTDFWIEHISDFSNAVGPLNMNDLTVLENKFDHQTYAWRTNKYDYKPVPNREEWSGGEWYVKFFSPFFSNYEWSAGKSETEEERPFASPDVSNDMQGIRKRPADFAKAGWTILPVVWYAGAIPPGAGWYYEDNNSQMQWDILTGDYWIHRRPFIWGVCGYNYYTSANWYTRNYTTKERSLRQVEIELHGCCEPFEDDFDITDLVTTELGDGLIESLSFNFMSGAMKMQLLYEADDVSEPVYPTGTPSATPTPTPTATTRPTPAP